MVTCIIELIGIKDELGVNNSIYSDAIENFRQNLQDSIISKKLFNRMEITQFNDTALIHFKDAEYVLEYLRILQKKMLSNLLIFRAIISAANIDVEVIDYIETDKGIKIRNIQYSNKKGFELRKKLDSFKGIGIILEEGFVSLISEDSKKLIFKNLFVPKNNFDRYTEYYDVKIHPDITSEYKFRNLMELFKGAEYIKPKYSRFFIPILINLCKNTSLPDWEVDIKNQPKVDSNGEVILDSTGKEIVEEIKIINRYDSIDTIIKDPEFKQKRNTTGFELIPLSLIERAFQRDDLSHLRLNELRSNLKKWQWVRNKLKKEDFLANIPNSILTVSSRIKFGKAIAQNGL